ncbi:uncharacterized protein [Struthio camelus]|uniref:uncharacterized protein n=1 Tax=Struthio camelus TaxID=8801 RepID=UPI003603D00F
MEGCWTETISPEQRSLFPTLLQLCTEEIVAIWDAVSNYILEQLMRDKGVLVAGLGTFCTVREPLHLGKDDVRMVRRPLFQLGMDMVWLQGLQRPKGTLPDDIKIKPLNYRRLSLATSFSRHVVEDCVAETIRLFSSHVRNKENVAFAFRDIGVLTRQKDSMHMRFYAHCTQRLEGTASLTAALCSRLRTTDLSVSGRRAALGTRSSPVHVFPRFQLTVESSPEAKAAPAGSPQEKELEEELGAVRSSKEQRPGKLLQHREELSLPTLPNCGAGTRGQGAERKPPARIILNPTAPMLGTSLGKEVGVKYLPHPPAGPRPGRAGAGATARSAAQETACPPTQSLGRAARVSLLREKQRQDQAPWEEQQAALEKHAQHQAQVQAAACLQGAAPKLAHPFLGGRRLQPGPGARRSQIMLLEKQVHLEQRRYPDTDMLGRPPPKQVSPQAKQNMQLMTSYKVLRDRWKERVEQNRQRLKKEEAARRALVMCRLRSREQQDSMLGSYHRNGFYPRK